MAGSHAPLCGQRALVTGASRGIGRAIALALADAGADVIVGYHVRHTEAEQVALAVRQRGRRAWAVAADLEQEEALDHLFTVARERLGGLDIFIANAAATAFKPLMAIESRHLDRSYALNWRAFVLGVQQAAAMMPDGGRIVAISGFGSDRCIPGYGVLGPLKAAIEASVRYFAVELADRGIRVNAVNPGFLHTDSSAVYFDRVDAAPEDHVVRMTPGGRATTVDDVAAVARFLCLPESAFIRGQTIRVDGGLTLVGPPYAAAMMPERGTTPDGPSRRKTADVVRPETPAGARP